MIYKGYLILLLLPYAQAAVNCKANTKVLKDGPAEFDLDFPILLSQVAWFNDN